MKRSLSVFLALLLALSLFAGVSFAENEEVVTLTMYHIGPNTHTFDCWINDYLEKTIGVRLEYIVKDDDKLQTMIAGGSLPDMGHFKLNNTLENAMLGDLLVNLDEYKEQLPNLYEKNAKVVEYSRKMLTPGYEGLYAMPVEIGIYNDYPIDTDTQSIKLRWDVYNQIGAPRIGDWDELIDVLAQMMEACPTADEGIKTWGWAFHGNGGQDVGLANTVLSVEGYMANFANAMVTLDLKTGEAEKMFDDDSAWYNAMKVIFKANQAGVLDPDTLTQTYDELRAKNRLGGTLSVMTGQYTGPYNTDEHMNSETNPSGYLEIAEDWLYPVGAAPLTYGGGNCISIAKNSKNVEKCVEFLNLFYDDYTTLVFYNGPEGDLWKLEGEELTATDLFMNEYLVKNEATLSDGTVFSTGSWWGPYAYSNCEPIYGKVFRQTSWHEFATLSATSKVYDLWRQAYADEGWYTPGEAYHAWGHHLYQPTWKNFIETMSEDNLIIYNACKQVWLEDMYKMAFAADEAEFEALYKDLQTRTQALGIETLQEWGLDQIEKAKELEKSFG